MSLALIGFALFKGREKIKVSALTYPYSYVSKVNNNDVIDIKLLINNNDSYFTRMEKIESAYISGIEGKMKLNIEKIEISDKKTKIKDDDYYLVHYYFNIDAKFDSNYYLFIKKAYLYLTYSNGTSTNIYIGSFTYVKYDDNYQDLSISSLKAINSKAGNDGFYGILIGIRNNKDELININSIELLDGNIKDVKMKIVDDITSSEYNDYFNDLNYVNKVEINNFGQLYLAISFEYDDNLVFPPSNIGLKINLNDASYYLDNFPFYTKTSLDLSKYDLIIYEYK